MNNRRNVMTDKDFVKETKEDVDSLTKQAIVECEESMYGTYDALDCICQKLKNFDWVDGKLFIKGVHRIGEKQSNLSQKI